MNIPHQANQIIVDGTYTIPTNVTETFEAKNIIRWKPGFKASTGSVVRAHVDPNAVFAASKMDELTYTYNSGTNKLQRVTDVVSSTAYAGDLDSQPVNNYAYDANGNMIQDLEKGIGYVLYDINNLPIRVYKTNGNVTDYIYDCQGERAKKITPTLSTWYINGVGSKTSFIKTSDINDSYTVNLYGNDAIGQARVVGGAPIRYYYLKDHLGSIRATINGTDGSLASYDDYYPFGMVMDNRSASFGNPDTRYKFTGKERDIETGYDYFGARYYDSRIGRWLTMDPLAEKYPGWSAYGYVADNPLKYFDPDGRIITPVGSTSEIRLINSWIARISATTSGRQTIEYLRGIPQEIRIGFGPINFKDEGSEVLGFTMPNTPTDFKDGKWEFNGADIVLDVKKRGFDPIGVTTHELRHAEQFAKDFNYWIKRGEEQKGLPHDDRQAEEDANFLRQRVKTEDQERQRKQKKEDKKNEIIKHNKKNDEDR